MGDILTSGEAYCHILLRKWEEIIELSEQFRTNLLAGEINHNHSYMYIARLTRLWGELYPKVKGRHDLGELITNFDLYRPYYYDPTQLIDETKSEEIFRLEETLREALEKLGILRWEK